MQMSDTSSAMAPSTHAVPVNDTAGATAVGGSSQWSAALRNLVALGAAIDTRALHIQVAAAAGAAHSRRLPAVHCRMPLMLVACGLQVSELLARGLSDLEERASELTSRQERLMTDVTNSSNSMTQALAQER